MGVNGLMTYVIQRSQLFLEPFKLHNTYLVLDGSSVVCQLYYLNNGSCCFGGNYEKYAFYINQFFDELLKCNIIPIVVMDGGLQHKKISTVYKRKQDTMYRIANINPYSKGQPIFPLLASVTFKYIAKKKNITCIYSMYEADSDAALIAKILNCPVLSSDSDFYLFDVLFIPYNTLKEGIFNNVNENGYFKQCNIFKTDYLIRNYPGINKSILPLCAAVLGNDYINGAIFKKFFSTLKVQENQQQTSLSHLKIEAVLRWSQNHTLDSAITAILHKINADKQEKVIETIETVINGYLNLKISSEIMLELLGLSKEKIDIFLNDLHHKTYKFEKLDNCEIEEKIIYDDECYLTSSDENDLQISTLSFEEDNSSFFKSETKDLSDIILPTWFLRKYHAGVFPAFFIDMINHQCIFVSEQVENLSYPTTFNISLKILSVIFKLLTTGLKCSSNILKYITRGNGIKLVMCELDCSKYKFNFSIPSLEKLIDYPANEKKKIFIDSMGVSEDLLLKFPPKWRLHIAALKFWMNEADKRFRTKYHLYALLFNIIWHVIKEVKYSGFGNIDQVHDTNENSCSFVENMSVKDALEKVDVHDCIISEEFFKSQLMYVNKAEYDVTIVHAFALFQHCLQFCIYLSSLLCDPYPQCNVADFLNGILVYNIFNNIKHHQKLNGHICKIFEKSPSLLQLFVSISTILI